MTEAGYSSMAKNPSVHSRKEKTAFADSAAVAGLSLRLSGWRLSRTLEQRTVRMPFSLAALKSAARVALARVSSPERAFRRASLRNTKDDTLSGAPAMNTRRNIWPTVIFRRKRLPFSVTSERTSMVSLFQW